jgi:RecJ-like exonuclease
VEPIVELTKKASERIKLEKGIIHLVSHFDADGISSAAIMTSALIKLKKRFYVTIVRHIIPEVVDNIKEKNCPLTIFTDIGSSYVDELEKIENDIIILDHHEVKKDWKKENIIQVNPEALGLKNMPGAWITNMVAKELIGSDELTPLALIGSIGDSTFPDLDFFEKHEKITREKGLRLFGRFSRPIHKAIQLCYDPEIPGISGSESTALQFLSEIGIQTKDGDEWRTLEDLKKIEVQKITDAIIKEHLKHKTEINFEDMFGDVWTLLDFDEELQDATEFATILNCCGRLDDAATGIGLCLNSSIATERSKKLIAKYRRMIGKYMRWIEEEPDRIRKSENARYILAGKDIHQNFIGTIISIYFRSSNSPVPVIGMADSDLGVKISGRCDGTININDIVSKAAAAVGGDGGGHREAAGATIPKGKEEEFVEYCNNLLK